MLDLSLVKTALEATSLAQVVLPENIGAQGPDSALRLLTLIEPAVSARAYPLVLPDEPAYPAAVYQQIGAERIEVDGYPILREDSYAVAALANTYAAASAAADTIRAAVLAYSPTGEAGAGDILDQSADYDVDFDLYEIAQQVRLTHLARANQALPAAFVYPVGEPWQEGDSVTCVTGQAVSRFVVLLAAKIPAGGVTALGSLRDEVLDAVAGLDPGNDWSLIEPAGGVVAAVQSSVVLWRDEFTTQQPRSFA